MKPPPIIAGQRGSKAIVSANRRGASVAVCVPTAALVMPTELHHRRSNTPLFIDVWLLLRRRLRQGLRGPAWDCKGL